MTIERYATDKPFPFADAVKANGFVFLSGQVSMTASGEPLYGSVVEQTRRIMQSIDGTLTRAGVSLDQVVRVQVWLSDMKHFAEFNAEYRTWFSNGFPARSVTSSALAFGLDVEVEVQATAS
ncbi:RidA family protein [Aeromonas sp. DNRA1]|uniref:RidA family protein n=1 Tax=unclassified Aeromonas TaxID=257493 RepID=UPI0014596785|nr:RidA family protein [Aeromonas sp. DNRA1]NME02543.1 RidA family protein [Aeromonas sp. DNRA1]